MNLKLKLSLALTALLSLVIPAAASAHVSVAPSEAPADGYALLNFVVPHGCEAAPTNRLVIKMPPQVISATPGVVAGWDLKTKEGKLPVPAEQHGETITEGVREVTWSGGPLPDGQLEQFPLSVAFSGEEGDVAEFKVIQQCAGGAETAWIQSTPASGEEPDHPAPAVTLAAAEADHHGGAAADDEEHSDEASHSEAASSSDSDDDSSDGLAIAALIVGALGLAAGGTALVSSRRSK
ncbi:MAG: YcnI family protein [Solirubrobacterales bacterium]